MSHDIFHNMTDVYEAMIDWPKRLAHEEGFYRRLFDRIGARSVVDVACGTGRHAAMFHSWGLRVEGADISTNMIERARTNFGEPPRLRWIVRGFDQPIHPTEPFDAVICTGNSLALVSDKTTVERALREMLAAIRKGGAVVLHTLNLWRLPVGPCVWQKPKIATVRQEPVLIAKGIHRSAAGAFVNLVIVPLNSPTEMRTESIPLLSIEADEFEQMLRKAGAANVRIFGDYDEQPYLRETSVDLIVVAEK